MILLAVVVNLLDVALSWTVIAARGVSAEANPLMAGAFSLGPLAALSLKAALLAVVFAAAALRPRSRRLLLGGVTAAGAVGLLSALVA